MGKIENTSGFLELNAIGGDKDTFTYWNLIFHFGQDGVGYSISFVHVWGGKHMVAFLLCHLGSEEALFQERFYLGHRKIMDTFLPLQQTIPMAEGQDSGPCRHLTVVVSLLDDMWLLQKKGMCWIKY